MSDTITAQLCRHIQDVNSAGLAQPFALLITIGNDTPTYRCAACISTTVNGSLKDHRAEHMLDRISFSNCEDEHSAGTPCSVCVRGLASYFEYHKLKLALSGDTESVSRFRDFVEAFAKRYCEILNPAILSSRVGKPVYAKPVRAQEARSGVRFENAGRVQYHR